MVFRGKRALVTGSSKGIGAACALAFAKEGAAVAVHYKSDSARAATVVDQIRALGGRAEAFGADLTAWDEGERLIAAAEEAVGPLDAVVLNHGIWEEAPIDTMTSSDYDRTFDANLRGVFSVAGAAARRMKPRKAGRLVLVASTAGQRGEAWHSHYAASKGAIISLTKSLAPELAPFGVLVNCVAPGWVATPMTEATLGDATARRTVLTTIPLGRVATPEEIAAPVVFLAGPGATFITGEVVNVNGGAVLVG